jgi:hypothetical protein
LKNKATMASETSPPHHDATTEGAAAEGAAAEASTEAAVIAVADYTTTV